MQKRRWLKDEYRFPGFVPLLPVKGVFGDPRAVVISLRRRRKKHAAAVVAGAVERTTINVHDKFATCRVVTSECIWPLTCVECSVRSVVA
jgi:hypothetical protein